MRNRSALTCSPGDFCTRRLIGGKRASLWHRRPAPRGIARGVARSRGAAAPGQLGTRRSCWRSSCVFCFFFCILKNKFFFTDLNQSITARSSALFGNRLNRPIDAPLPAPRVHFFPLHHALCRSRSIVRLQFISCSRVPGTLFPAAAQDKRDPQERNARG